MNIESFEFVLAVALFGITVVFGLLTLLSMFMSGMQGVDRIIPTASNGAPPATRKERRTSRKPAKPASHNWVIAAAVAYLVLEEEDARPEAASWTGGRSFRGDPWLINNFGDQT